MDRCLQNRRNESRKENYKEKSGPKKRKPNRADKEKDKETKLAKLTTEEAKMRWIRM